MWPIRARKVRLHVGHVWVGAAETFNNYFAKSRLNHSLALTESEFDNHLSIISLINELINDQDLRSKDFFQFPACLCKLFITPAVRSKWI